VRSRKEIYSLRWLCLSLFLCGVFLPAVPDVRAETAINERGVRAAQEYSRKHHGLSLLVVQNGRTLLDDNAERFRYPIFSGTKAFWCLAALSAAQEGLLSLDEPASDTLTEWRGDPRRRAIRIRQLLDFTCGLESASHLHRINRPNRDREALKISQVASPGSAFIYGPGQLQAFDELLRRKLHGGSTTDYLERRVLRPLGIESAEYRRDRAGNPLLASGFDLTPEEWSRMGRLVLNGGRAGLRTVASRDLFEQCFRGTTANPAFGFGFWLNREAATREARVVDVETLLNANWRAANWHHACLSRDAPADLVVSLGSHGQRLYAVPSLDLIVVRQGHGDGFRDAAFLSKLFAR
jgi:CubicO group peptidase (beta-lactamase class C family)